MQVKPQCVQLGATKWICTLKANLALTWLGSRTTYLGQHAGEQGVGGNVEGHPEAQVCRALVHLARQLALRHRELHAQPLRCARLQLSSRQHASPPGKVISKQATDKLVIGLESSVCLSNCRSRCRLSCLPARLFLVYATAATAWMHATASISQQLGPHLAEHVAGGQGHLWQCSRIPC